MRIFKAKGMVRFARRERITDSSLEIERAERGSIDADLAGGLIKQRVARPGQGRSGGFRMIVAYREANRAVFLYGFAKNERSNISGDELQSLRILGANWLADRLQQLNRHWPLATCRRLNMTTNKRSRLASELVEMADAQHRLGIMDQATHQKITTRHLGSAALPTAEPITASQVREVREKAHLSQAAFARFLNMTTSYVSQLERGATQAKGPALALLNVIRRKGIEALL